jgi:hypothetical protein
MSQFAPRTAGACMLEPPVAVGGNRVDREQVGVHGGNAADMGAPSRA